MKVNYIFLAALAAIICCCARKVPAAGNAGEEPAYFSVLSDTSFVVISPYTGERDTVSVGRPCTRLVCMSSSYLGCLEAIGRTDIVAGVSGIGYVSDTSLTARATRTLEGVEPLPVWDVGYEAAPDYERIVAMEPDFVVTYTVSSAVPQYVTKLRSLGVKVLVIYEHLENHPLARSQYVRLFGILSGCPEKADSAFAAVSARYHELAAPSRTPAKVLVNIPYGDQWFLPGGDNYMSALVRDAGGEILGAQPGRAESSVISLEEALVLSRDADVWLNTGWCTTRAQLRDVNPSFRLFEVPRIYNNTLRTTAEGGNDFWESGAFRADLILEDLCTILGGTAGSGSLNYYLEVD